MTIEQKCSDCKHRAPRNICNQERSPHYNRPVESTDSCEYFLENPAERHFFKGMVSILEDRYKAAITELDTAIALGLPHDTEMQAHYFLGSAYSSVVAASSDLTAAQQVEMPEFDNAIREHEKGIRMDRDAGYNFFSTPINRANLGKYDLECALAGSFLPHRQGPKRAIAYLEEKLKTCDHLSSTPMLMVLLQLGTLYAETNEEEKAADCFERILRAEPVNRVDEQGLEAETRRMARNNLDILAEKKNVPPGRSTKSSAKPKQSYNPYLGALEQETNPTRSRGSTSAVPLEKSSDPSLSPWRGRAILLGVAFICFFILTLVTLRTSSQKPQMPVKVVPIHTDFGTIPSAKGPETVIETSQSKSAHLNENGPSSSEVVSRYWLAVGTKDYNTAWTLLSLDFRNRNHAGDYDNYVHARQSMHICSVAVVDLESREVSQESAVVEGSVVFRAGRSCRESKERLIFYMSSDGRQGWSIDRVAHR